MKQSYKTKIVFFSFLALMLFFFISDFKQADSDQSAIVIALGIDKKGEKFEVYSQVIEPPQAEGQREGKGVLLTTQGDTVGGALSNIATITGFLPNLSNVNLIVISKTLAENDILDAIGYFVRTQIIEDSALMILSEKSPKDLLEKSTPLSKISSQSIEQILNQKNVNVNDVPISNLKDFIKVFYSVGIDNFIPIFKEIESETAPKPEGGQTGTSGEQKKEIYLDGTKTAIFSKDRLSGHLDTEDTEILNLLLKEIKGSKLLIKDVQLLGNETFSYEVDLTSGKKSIDPKITTGAIEVTISLKLKAVLKDYEKSPNAISDYVAIGAFEEDLEREAARQINERLSTLCEKLAVARSDILGIGNKLHKFKNKEFKDLTHSLREGEHYLDYTIFKIQVEFEGQLNAKIF